jgi:hypothetical protein
VGEIKVSDRRMFTPEGELRADVARQLAEPSPEPPPVEIAAPEPPSGSPAPAVPEAPPPESPRASALPDSAPENPPPGLLELVELLSGYALAAMGEVPMPDGRLVRDLDAARFYIDLIGAFHERWAKHLGLQEQRFLESYLDQLRLRYVAHRG